MSPSTIANIVGVVIAFGFRPRAKAADGSAVGSAAGGSGGGGGGGTSILTPVQRTPQAPPPAVGPVTRDDPPPPGPKPPGPPPVPFTPTFRDGPETPTGPGVTGPFDGWQPARGPNGWKWIRNRP